jgi:hypothetical protein
MATAGYSGRSLTQKLGVKPGDLVRPIDAPEHYAGLLDPLPDGARLDADALEAAIVQAFVRSVCDLETRGPELVDLPAPGGAIWISWPKKTSAMFVDLTEDGVRRVMLPTGWVDVKVCAVDADWSGLKFLRRRSARPSR